jgi:hypothetical protein
MRFGIVAVVTEGHVDASMLTHRRLDRDRRIPYGLFVRRRVCAEQQMSQSPLKQRSRLAVLVG